ncbi:peptidylprolyl isomerase [Yinghuangia seranimata]|uniref:peptidylprolyl isomerase n=1 Tax=Yinghuangia seranimata TaxID=408067 RepID=UPI0031B9C1D0
MIGSVAAVVALAVIGGIVWAATSGGDDKGGSATATTTGTTKNPTDAPTTTTSPTSTSTLSPWPTTPSKPSNTTNPGAADQFGCTPPTPGTPTNQWFTSAPAMSIDKAAPYEMVLKTTCGDITVALDAAKAPTTVNSFNFLAGKNYFDHTKCHRLTTDGIYVLQCGDPTGTGTGTPGYAFPDENLTGATYPAGTIAMANSGPNTNGSQFFLVFKDTQLPPQYTPFGKITGGMDVLTRIATAGTADGSADGTPKAPVVLNQVTVAKKR